LEKNGKMEKMEKMKNMEKLQANTCCSEAGIIKLFKAIVKNAIL
jgi:hypothetical protein